MALCLSSLHLVKLIAEDGECAMRVKKQINVEVGNQIKIAREMAKLTQEQFSEQIEVSPQYVSDLERGVVGVSLSTLRKACIVLGVSSDQIIFGSAKTDRQSAISNRCNALTDTQFKHLLNIMDHYIAAVKDI